MIFDGISIFDGEKQYLSLDTNLKTDILNISCHFFQMYLQGIALRSICDRYLFDMVVKYDKSSCNAETGTTKSSKSMAPAF